MPIDTEILAQIQKNAPSLTKLDLTNQHLTDEDMVVLFRALEGNISVKELDLAGNYLKSPPPFCKEHSIKELNLAENEITSIDFLKDDVTIETLDLGHNKITDLSPLNKNKNLISLIAQNNLISSADAIKDHPSLTHLNLDDNTLTDITFLHSSSKIQGVSLRNNKISDISALASSSNALEFIDLAVNQIRDLKPLSENTSIQTIVLCGNPIEDIEPLFSNRTLHTILLPSTFDEQTGKIEALCERNRKPKDTKVGFSSRPMDLFPKKETPNVGVLALADDSSSYTLQK